MKYKVVLYDVNNAPEGAAFTFYTNYQAIACCEAWVQISAAYIAHLWDGTTWTRYQQVP